jgi:hypothetical protein
MKKLNHSLPAFTAIVLAGGSAASFDIVYAVVSALLKDRSAIGVLQAVASGLMGASAFEGGAITAAFGLFCHFTIMLCAAGLFFFGYSKVAYIRNHFVLVTLAFGTLFYAVMHSIILPLSAIPFKFNYSLVNLAQGLCVHIALVSLPINYCIRRFYGERFLSLG